MNLREVTMKYGRLAVYICHDSAEIWGFNIGTLKIMASTGVFVRIVCALKDSSSNFSTTPSTIFT